MEYKFVWADGKLDYCPAQFGAPGYSHHQSMTREMGYNDAAGWPENYTGGYYWPELDKISTFGYWGRVPSNDELKALLEKEILPDHTGSHQKEANWNYKWVWAGGRLFVGPAEQSHYGILQRAGFQPSVMAYNDWACGYYDPATHQILVDGGTFGNTPGKDQLAAMIEKELLPDHTGSYFFETQAAFPKKHEASSPDDLHRFVYHRGRVKMAPSWDTYHQALANELLSENEPATAPYGFAGGFYRPSTGELNRGEKLSLGGPPVPDEVLAQALKDKASELYGSSVHAGARIGGAGPGPYDEGPPLEYQGPEPDSRSWVELKDGRKIFGLTHWEALSTLRELGIPETEIKGFGGGDMSHVWNQQL